MADRQKFTSVEEYLEAFSGETKSRLEVIRGLIRELAPDATERISYNMPGAFIGKLPIIYYSGYEHHVSIYPGELLKEHASQMLEPYFSGKGTALAVKAMVSKLLSLLVRP